MKRVRALGGVYSADLIRAFIYTRGFPGGRSGGREFPGPSAGVFRRIQPSNFSWA